MKLVTEKFEVSKKDTKESEYNGNTYVNYRLYYMSDGYMNMVDVPKDVYDNVDVGEDVRLEVDWFFNRKKNKFTTFVTGLHLGK